MNRKLSDWLLASELNFSSKKPHLDEETLTAYLDDLRDLFSKLEVLEEIELFPVPDGCWDIN